MRENQITDSTSFLQLHKANCKCVNCMCKFSCRKGLRPSHVLVNMFHSKRVVAMKKENLKVVRTYEWSINRLQLGQFQTLGSQPFHSIIDYGHIYFRNAE